MSDIPNNLKVGTVNTKWMADSIVSLESELATCRKELADAQRLNAAYLSELKDYGQTVKRLRRELEEARKETDGIGLERMMAAQARDEITSLKGELAACEDCHEKLEKENDRLRAELDRRKLKWQKGIPPWPGNYWIKGIFENYAVHPLLIYVEKPEDLLGEWAGPIEPPEES